MVTGRAGKQQRAESSHGSLVLVDSGALLWDTHAVLVVVFYLLLISSDVQRVGELGRLGISLWQMMAQDIFRD